MLMGVIPHWWCGSACATCHGQDRLCALMRRASPTT